VVIIMKGGSKCSSCTCESGSDRNGGGSGRGGGGSSTGSGSDV
jgi:hypothetical protein